MGVRVCVLGWVSECVCEGGWANVFVRVGEELFVLGALVLCVSLPNCKNSAWRPAPSAQTPCAVLCPGPGLQDRG